MAVARLKKKDQRYEQLVQGSSQLHKDIENLETAYFLHRQIVEEDQNTVKGIIRKEIGGPRWEHGGAGKLTTYKSRKDLVDQNEQIPKNEVQTLHSNQADQSWLEQNAAIQALDENAQTFKTDVSPVKSDKILDLKTKVLKKASSHVIRRDTWSAPSNTRTSKPLNNKISKARADQVKNNSQDNNASTLVNKSQKPVKKSNSLKRESNEKSRSPAVVAQKSKENRQNKNQSQTGKKERKRAVNEDSGIESQRRSRIDMFKDNEENARLLRHSVTETYMQNGTNSDENLGNKSDRTKGMTYTPRKSQSYAHRVNENGISSGVFPTQPVEPTEIYIDPRKGQVRILAGRDESFSDISSLDRTKILVEPGSLQNSVDGNRLNCSVVDADSGSSPQREIRDIFGLEDLKGRPEDTYIRQVTSTSPFAATRQCNTEVEFWLRGLGIPDVDRYVRIFADNEIDLTDLEFMSASQLHDMGVTTLGALDKILKGIRNLKNQPVNDKGKSGEVRFQSSSIAWEEISPTQRKQLSDEKSSCKARKKQKDNSCHHETFVKQSGEFSLFRRTDTDNERCDSAMSNSTGYFESAKSSARSETPSFAASTMSSSAKCTEKKPPSAKPNIVGKNKSNCNQTQNKCVSSSAPKLKRSNSAASEKSVSKLSNLDVKPSKGVLLRPRSASMTRESSSGGRETPVKKIEEKKEPQQLRCRSRSADVVKRKALEGVHAAAKKYEERKSKTRDADKSFPPCDEKKKLRRDEMAARHLQREKYKELVAADSCSSDNDEIVKKQVSRDIDADQGLENLVTVNILSPPGKSDPQVLSSKQEERGRTQVIRPDMRKSLRRLEQTRNQTYKTVRPVDFHMNSDIDPPLLSTYKNSSKDKDRSQSEPESGYRTDASTTYSQIENRVSDIQMKIKRLKARATSGDEMTLTLVHDLQEQLLHFERQLKEKEMELRNHQSDPESSRGDNTARKVSNSVNHSCNTSPISELLVESPGRTEGVREQLGAGVRMSKKELLDEMRKEKQQHHRQIRQLQSELQKFRHSDPVTSLELEPRDISYRQDDLIGDGTFSRVYKGEFQGSEVAVKQLKMPLQQQDRNYFAAEVSLLKELRHPRVVLLIGVCTTSKLPLMVLEYMSQGSLFNFLHNPQCESLDHALYYQVARDIALGMNYLHSHKPEVLHLDLKSMNVLLCQSMRAKIADFGFSKLRLDAGLKSGKRGKPKSGAATPAWMSPELLDKGEITGKSDVYSFGIILWEMLTRRSPYTDSTVFQILEMVRKNKRPEIPDGTPEGLSHLIRICWDPNPAKRPQFKDILQILENLAFPPAWRELFQKAGVPESALQDVQSTRTIISLVTGTLDSGNSGILHSFMVAHSEKGKNGDKKQNVETKSTFKSQRASSEKKKNTKQSSKETSEDSARSSKSSQASNMLEDWESDTVTSVSEKLSSDESELTLKNIRDSSSDEHVVSSDSDESSVLTSDDDIVYSEARNNQKKPRAEINVVIPNLELSLQSARDEFKAARERINRENSDWVSVSLDDSTNRSERHGTSQPADINTEHGDMRLRLSSSLSNGTPTPTSPSKFSMTLNESARSKRRNKSKDLNCYSDEFLMRESFHNRRPPSPKKKSLSKKFMQNSDRHSGSENIASSEDYSERSEHSNKDRKQFIPNKDSFVERSYDSFFDLSGRAPVSEHSVSKKIITSNTGNQNVNTSVESKQDNDRRVELVRASQSKIPNNRYSVYNESEICVEDMENEVADERSPMMRKEMPDSKSQPHSSWRNPTQENKQGSDVNKSQSIVKEEKSRSKAEMLEYKQPAVEYESKKICSEKSKNCNQTGTEKSYNNYELQRSNGNRLHKLKTEEVNSARKSQELLNNNNISQNTCIEKMNENNSARIVETEKATTIITEGTQNGKQGQVTQNVESIGDSDSETGNVIRKTTCHSEENNKSISEKGSEEKHSSSRPLGSSADNIRVVLNTMLASRDGHLGESLKNPAKSLDLSLPSYNKNTTHSKKSSVEEMDIHVDRAEQIRVTLDLEKVAEQKKKPAITPRRSLMLSNRSPRIGEKTISEHLRNTKTLNSDQLNDKESEFDSFKRNISRGTPTNVTTGEQKECKTESVNHDRGSSPNNRPVSRPNGENAYIPEPRIGPVENKPSKAITSPKKNTIRVKLRKDPLAAPVVTNSSDKKQEVSSITAKPSSPIPPAPPPPPPELTRSVSVVSRSVQDSAPRSSMADELKSTLANRQSVSEGMLHRNKGAERNGALRKQSQGNSVCVPRHTEGEPRLVKISEIDEKLVPQQSEGLPSFMVQSLDLREQKDQLRSISRPHPHQLDDLSNASQEQLTSIADILKKAVMGRRLAMGEDGDSVSQSLESAATGWSVDL